MAKKDEQEVVNAVVEPVETVEPAFSKEQLIASKRYQHRRDALSVVLQDGETYTYKQAETLLDNFMKGKVN